MAIRFNKTNGNYLSRSAFGSANATYTIMMWVYLVSNPANGAYYGVYIKETDQVAQEDAGEIIRNNPNTKVTTWDGATENTSTTNLSLATWYHLCWVRESATILKLYINGSLDHTGGTANQGGKDGFLRVGCWDATTDPADIRVSAMKIWNVGLTLAEVKAEMYSILPRRTAGLIRLSPCFAGATERLRDYSANNSSWTTNGTLTDEASAPIPWTSSNPTPFLTPLVIGGDALPMAVDQYRRRRQ